MPKRAKQSKNKSRATFHTCAAITFRINVVMYVILSTQNTGKILIKKIAQARSAIIIIKTIIIRLSLFLIYWHLSNIRECRAESINIYRLFRVIASWRKIKVSA